MTDNLSTLQHRVAQRIYQGYVDCALWTETDDEGDPLEDNFQETDLTTEAKTAIWGDCLAFFLANEDHVYAVDYDDENVGHDFWLTRNGHGTGFWDRDATAAFSALDASARSFGECSLYVGDDGRLHYFNA